MTAEDASFNNSVYIKENLIVDGNISVVSYNNEYIVNTTTSDYTLIVAEDLSLNGRLLVNDDASFNDNVYIQENLIVGNDNIGSHLTQLDSSANTASERLDKLDASSNLAATHRAQLDVSSNVAATPRAQLDVSSNVAAAHPAQS